MTPADYLDKIREAYGLNSDYKLAKLMKWSTAKVSNYRTGRRTFDIREAAEVALVLKDDFGKIVANMEEHRAKEVPEKNFWATFRSNMEKIEVAAVLSIFVTNFMTETPLSPSIHAASALKRFLLC